MNTYLNDLLGYKNKKTRHLFRWKIVEAYRAERVQASELEETLGISKTELRRLNRSYFRYHLSPLLHSKNRCKPMKREHHIQTESAECANQNENDCRQVP